MADLVAKLDNEICQILGKVLKYPWYKDDPKNFPDATESDGVCVGEHTAETIAMETAAKIERLQKRVEAAEAQAVQLANVVEKALAFVLIKCFRNSNRAREVKQWPSDQTMLYYLDAALAAYKEEFENVQNTTKA